MTTRQELYDRIRQSSKDEVILEEMIRLGFWPKEQTVPEDPAEDIRRKGELERELSRLSKENRSLHNIEQLKRQARKERLAASRAKRLETKQKRLELKRQRASQWLKAKQTEIVFLGKGVSKGLSERTSDDKKLVSLELPHFANEAKLASAMEISVGELRFLAFSRTTSKVSHYKRFAIEKKSGGLRHISAPMPRLKRAQKWILENILERVELSRHAHGFRKGRSIMTNAKEHVGKDVVVNIDLQNFFPTVHYKRIKGVFRKLGYAENLATVFALLCSEPVTKEIELDGETYFVATKDRALPQGAPTSPALTNIICRGLDVRLEKAAEQFGYAYSRYADDLTFSACGDAKKNVGKLLHRVNHVVKDESFYVHPNKTRVFHKGRRQEVTGLVVNEKLAVPRTKLRNFKAVLFQIEKDGPAGKKWGNGTDLISSIEGYANFVAMVDMQKGELLQRRVAQIIERYGRTKADWPIRNPYEHKPIKTQPQDPPSDSPEIGETQSKKENQPKDATDSPEKKKSFWSKLAFWKG